MLEEVAIECPNKAKGCEDLVFIMKLSNHEKLCLYEIDKCKAFMWCKYEGYRHSINAHEDACSFVCVKCEYCTLDVQKRLMNKHHEKEC
jgi:hypothetical protein